MTDFASLIEDLGKLDVEPAAQDAAAEAAQGEGVALKSFSVTLADGTKADAVDAEELLKALHGDVEALKGDRGTLEKALILTGGLVQKQHKALGELSALVKSLQADMAKIQAGGRGRQTVVTVLERGAGGGEAEKPATITGEELMTKAMALFNAGKMNSLEIGSLENAVGRGVQPREDLVKRVIAG